MSNFFFRIPSSQLEAATTLQREITGREDDPPIFALDRARGSSRVESWLYAHGQLWTVEQTEEFARRIEEVGGVATLTYDRATKHREPVEVMQGLGPVRRPDLERLTVAQIRARAQEEGVVLKGATRKADLIDAFEADSENTTPAQLKPEQRERP